MSRQNIKGSMKLMLKQRSWALPRKKVRNFWYSRILTCSLKAEKLVAKEGFASWTSWEPCSSFNVALREEFNENQCSQIWIILNVICDILCSSFNDGKQRIHWYLPRFQYVNCKLNYQQSRYMKVRLQALFKSYFSFPFKAFSQ